MSNSEVVIVGAGVIGLSTAFCLALEGSSVTLLDPFPGRGASYVAAGMIAPVTEAVYGEEALAQLMLAASRRWPAFVEQLERHTHLASGLDRSGTLFVATNHNDRALLRDLLPLYHELGLEASWRSSEDIRRLEPLLAPLVRGGIDAPGDVQIDNRRLLACLADAVANLGVVTARTRALSLVHADGRVRGVESDTEIFEAPYVVVAAGWASSGIDNLPAGQRPELRPVKGQILRLFQHDRSLRIARTVRALVAGRSIYLVPRSSGQVIVGATVEERGAELRPTAGATHDLLHDAIAIVPALEEAELQSVDVGLRPGSIDNAPYVGESEIDGLVYATGHYRHGVLLAPLTAAAIVDIVRGRGTPRWALDLQSRRRSPNAPIGL